MELYSPWVLVLGVLAPLALWLMVRRRGRGRVGFSSIREVKGAGRSWRVRLRWLPGLARAVCIGLLVLVLARPREGSKFHRVSTKGVALMLVVDRSGSMAAEMGYEGEGRTRLEVVKRVLGDFIEGSEVLEGRPNDLLGLVTFARYADTVCPLVQAHDALSGFLDQAEVVPQRSQENATAIGDAVALAAARLKKAEEEIAARNARLRAAGTVEEGEEGDEVKPAFEIQSKAIVLLTDGRNNAGRFAPMAAVEKAKEWGITVYTIGIGGGESYTKVKGMFGDFVMPTRQELDEGLLRALAEQTGGFYGRAGDGEALRTICEQIDAAEKSEIESVEYSRYEEKFSPLALAALLMLAVEIGVQCVVFRKVP